MKLKGCPLLLQSDTFPSITMAGESHTRTYMLECAGIKCAAFYFANGKRRCKKFEAVVDMTERKEKEGDGND